MNRAQNLCLDESLVKFGSGSLMAYISWFSDFLRFFRLGQFLSNCWSYSSDTWHLQTSQHGLLNAVIYIRT